MGSLSLPESALVVIKWQCDSRLGLVLRPCPTSTGAVVKRISDHTNVAGGHRLAPGDLLMSIDGQNVEQTPFKGIVACIAEKRKARVGVSRLVFSCVPQGTLERKSQRSQVEEGGEAAIAVVVRKDEEKKVAKRQLHQQQRKDTNGNCEDGRAKEGIDELQRKHRSSSRLLFRLSRPVDGLDVAFLPGKRFPRVVSVQETAELAVTKETHSQTLWGESHEEGENEWESNGGMKVQEYVHKNHHQQEGRHLTQLEDERSLVENSTSANSDGGVSMVVGRIFPGDILAEIEGQPTNTMTASEIREKLRALSSSTEREGARGEKKTLELYFRASASQSFVRGPEGCLEEMSSTGYALALARQLSDSSYASEENDKENKRDAKREQDKNKNVDKQEKQDTIGAAKFTSAHSRYFRDFAYVSKAFQLASYDDDAESQQSRAFSARPLYGSARSPTSSSASLSTVARSLSSSKSSRGFVSGPPQFSQQRLLHKPKRCAPMTDKNLVLVNEAPKVVPFAALRGSR